MTGATTRQSIAVPWLVIGISLLIGCQSPEHERTVPFDSGSVDTLSISTIDGGAVTDGGRDSAPPDEQGAEDGANSGNGGMDASDDDVTTGTSDDAAPVDVPPEVGPPDLTPVGPCGLGSISLPTVGWNATVSVLSPGDFAQKAFDGDLASRWSTGRNGARGHWFRLDLGSSRTVTRIQLDAGGGVFATDFLRDYVVEASTDGNRYDMVATGTGSTVVTTISLSEVQARYLRITLTMPSPRWWGIAEMMVCGR